MGSVDVIPGISGGTIAFITGIYQDLIKSIDKLSFKKLITGQFRILWEDVNGSFLLSLFLGIITGVFFLSGILIYLFRYHPISMSAFLFGIIFATFFKFIGLIKNKKIVDYIYLLVSLTVSISITQLNSFSVEPNLIYLFFCSVIAASAMILPGISGAMIFLIFGIYNEILLVVQNSVRILFNFNIEDFISIYSKVISISLGIILGLKVFSRFVIWLFNYKKRKTVLILTGLVGGSLPKLWPLKECLNVDTINNLFKSNSDFMICKTNEIAESILFILAGLVLILVFNRFKKTVEYF